MGDGTAYQDVDQNDLGNISSYFQELRLSGKVFNDKLSWILGGNYGKDDSAEAQRVDHSGHHRAAGAVRIQPLESAQ